VEIGFPLKKMKNFFYFFFLETKTKKKVKKKKRKKCLEPCLRAYPKKTRCFFSCKPFFVSSSARIGYPIPKTRFCLPACNDLRAKASVRLSHRKNKPACPPACLPACPSACPPACLPACLPVC
jgi:hypothetical protein